MLDPHGQIASAWGNATVIVVSPAPTHPKDYGNRKRIYRICKILQQAGAKIHFVHYASENEWRNRVPLSPQKAMMTEWDGYYLVAPSRSLHPEPAGSHHTVDEWWDPNLGSTLTWLSDKLRPDVVIVNYTWLSKALEFAPKYALKILDTHDKFSGRKELLESYDIRPEFFYTTEEEEAKALDRADIVWAIKHEEELLLQKLTARTVRTVPHIDPSERIPARATAIDAADFELRVGFMGAKNSINRKNLLRFLIEAEPVFKSYLAPVKIVIGGTICELLDQIDFPFVEKVGWVDDVEKFYRDIDVAIVPMEFSTGLKIKTAEAISYGLPLISHAHAFEGYEPQHPFHSLTSFRDMAFACLDVAVDPAQLESLRKATDGCYTSAVAAVAKGIIETGHALQGSDGHMLCCLSPEATRRRSFHGQIARANVEYLSYCRPVVAYLDSIVDVEGALQLAQNTKARKVYLNPAIKPALADADIARLEDVGCLWSAFESLMEKVPVASLWLDHLPVHEIARPSPRLRRVYLNIGLLAPVASGGAFVPAVRRIAGSLARVSVVADRDTPVASWLRTQLNAERIGAPPFWPGNFELIWQFPATDASGQFGLNAIVPTRDHPSVELLADIARAAGEPRLNIIETDRDDDTTERKYVRGCDYRYFSRRAMESSKRDLLRWAKLTINLAHGDPFANLLASVFDAAGHQIVEVFDNGEFTLDRTVSRGLLSFVELVHGALKSPPPNRDIAAIRATQMRGDPGWSRVWNEISAL
jgi:hypothetical protein